MPGALPRRTHAFLSIALARCWDHGRQFRGGTACHYSAPGDWKTAFFLNEHGRREGPKGWGKAFLAGLVNVRDLDYPSRRLSPAGARRGWAHPRRKSGWRTPDADAPPRLEEMGRRMVFFYRRRLLRCDGTALGSRLLIKARSAYSQLHRAAIVVERGFRRRRTFKRGRGAGAMGNFCRPPAGCTARPPAELVLLPVHPPFTITPRHRSVLLFQGIVPHSISLLFLVLVPSPLEGTFLFSSPFFSLSLFRLLNRLLPPYFSLFSRMLSPPCTLLLPGASLSPHSFGPNSGRGGEKGGTIFFYFV